MLDIPRTSMYSEYIEYLGISPGNGGMDMDRKMKGAVESYEKTAENGRTRKYYHLTKKGQRTLGKKREEWETYEKAVRAVLEGGASFAF